MPQPWPSMAADDDMNDDERDLINEARMRNSVASLMTKLVHDPSSLTTGDLFVLSDLSRSDMEIVEEALPRIRVEHRRQLLRGLIESALEMVELDLGRLLRIALHDDDPDVRQLALAGLWEDQSPDLVGVFVQMMMKDSVVAVRAAAAAALGSFVLAGELDEIDTALAMRIEQALLEVLHNEAEPLEVQCRALESVAYSSETGLHQLIEDAYYSPHSDMQLSAVIAMGRSADTRWRGLVRAELSNTDPAMRVAAAAACGELEAKSATKELVVLLDDDDKEVQRAAISALGRIGGKDVRSVLRELANSDDDDIAEAADEALEEMLFRDESGSVALLAGEGDDDDDDDDGAPWEKRWDEE